MIGLRELRQPNARDWSEAAASFSLPQIETYNIAADCLRGGAPGAPALLVVDGDTVVPVSFAELDERTAAFAHALGERGVEPDARVAVKLSQSLEMAVAILGTLRAGCVFVPISNVLGADGIRHRLEHSGARVVVAADGDITPDDIGGMRGGDDSFARTAPDEPALLLYTSGTTGKPKGVLHGHRVVLGHHPIDWAWDRVRADDVSYSPVDWAWAGGLFLGLLVPLAYGVPVIAYREPRFDAERTLDVLSRCGASIGLFPPTVLRMLRQARIARSDLRLRCFITGAEAVEPELFGWSEHSLGVVVNNAYGLTEANALVGHSRALGALDPVALGRPYPGRRLVVVDDDGKPTPPGEHGQIAVAADDPVCMLRYWNDDEATAARIVDGWLRTGDTVHADADGMLHFHGRADDIIKSGAYRIGPAEVEAALLRHDAVAECAVVGLPDPVRGQTVTAIVRLRNAARAGDEALVAELQSTVRGAVGAHAYPRDIRFVEELPKTTTGKVDRATLRRDLVPA